jgi:phosphatidylinositol alpha-1,6-mannosyltransferase
MTRRIRAVRRDCLFISYHFPPPLIGGSLVLYYHLLSGCTARDVIVLTHKSQDAAEFDAGAPYAVRRSRAIRDPAESRLRRLGWYLLLTPIFMTWIARFRVSVVHLGVWVDIIPGFLASRLTRRALVISIHGEELTTRSSAERQLLFRWLWRIHDKIAFGALRRADCILANSRFTKSVLLGLRVPEERIVVITPGADLDKAAYGASPDPAIEERLAGSRVLLTVGRFEFRKGQDMVLRALPSLVEDHPDLHYVMAGGTSPEMQQYFHGLVRDLRLEDRVTLLPNLSNQAIAYLYDKCEVFIMANREMPNGDTEGYGIVFLEAGVWGKPVIGGRAGGVVEAVDDGITGILVDGTSIEDIAGAIGRLLADPPLAKQMGEAGRKKAGECSWGAKSDQYRSVLARLAARRTQHR